MFFVVQVLQNNNNVYRIMTIFQYFRLYLDLTNTTIRRNHDRTISCNDRTITISIFQ